MEPGAQKAVAGNGHAAPGGSPDGSHTLLAPRPRPASQAPSTGPSVGFGGARPPGPSTRLAFIVLAIAITITVMGAVASGLAGGSGSKPSSKASVPTVKASPLRAAPAASAISHIASEGLPPADIVDALVVPVGTSLEPGAETNSGLGSYDSSIGLSVAATEQQVITFFREELPAALWQVVSQGEQGTGVYQILAQHPGSDGYEWEVGVDVKPEVFPAGSASGTTPFSIRLLQESDDV